MTVSCDAAGSAPPVVAEIADLIRKHSSFIIAGHVRPDGDCLGSGLALQEMLRGMGKQVVFYTPGPTPSYLGFMPGYQTITYEIPTVQAEVTIYVDSGAPDRVHEDFKAPGMIVNIDHHRTNTMFGAINWVDTDAAAAGEQIYILLRHMQTPIGQSIATNLYVALMTDTGGFRYSNTDRHVFECAAHLVACGAEPARMAELVYDSRNPKIVQLTGIVYAALQYEFDGRFVWCEITKSVYDQVGADYAEPEGLSSDIRGIDGVRVAVLFFETEDGLCRIGLRSKGDLSVSTIAEELGGGGHHNASGAMLRIPYAQARDKALGVIRRRLQEFFDKQDAR